MIRLLTVSAFELLDGARVRLAFNDGQKGIADLSTAVAADPRATFSELRDPSYFRKARLARGTMVWPNGLELEPEYLYFLAFRDEPELEATFRRWGYLAPAQTA